MDTRGILTLPLEPTHPPRALDDARICLASESDWPFIIYNTLLIIDVSGPAAKVIQEIKHENCSAFCVSADRKFLVTASGVNCCIWNIPENKMDEITLVEKIEFKFDASIKYMKAIFLTKDNQHLIGLTQRHPYLFVFNLLSKKTTLYPESAWQELHGLQLLEYENKLELLCIRANLLFTFAINLSAKKSNEMFTFGRRLEHFHTPILNTAVSPDCSSCACHGYKKIWVFDLVTDKKREMDASCPYSEMSLAYLDNQTLAYYELLSEDGAEVWQTSSYRVNLNSPELKAEQCLPILSGERNSYQRGFICPMPGGFLEVAGQSCARIIYPGYQLIQQAKEAIFQYYLYGNLPFSSPILNITSAYTGHSSKVEFDFFDKDTSPKLTEREFLNAILEKLVNSGQFTADDRLVLQIFLREAKKADVLLADCKNIALGEVNKPDKLSPITFCVVDFLDQLAKLDDPIKTSVPIKKT